MLFGFAERLELDGAGRIRIPALHLELTGLSADVMVIGVRDRLELRSREAWHARAEARLGQFEALVAKLRAAGGEAPAA
jgi:DNA-binding transcriptional regulator/RsmH inhibitor MraZ